MDDENHIARSRRDILSDSDKRSDMVELKISMARMEERQINMAGSMVTIAQKLDTLVTKEAVKAIEDRVEGLEATRTWVARGLLAAIGTALLGFIGLGHIKL